MFVQNVVLIHPDIWKIVIWENVKGATNAPPHRVEGGLEARRVLGELRYLSNIINDKVGWFLKV